MLIIANEVEIIRGDEIEIRDVEWLWYPYIPFGKITLIQGDPGDGKSTFALNLAAMLTAGIPFPFTETDGSTEPMTVIYQNTEDDSADTVMPRFLQAGGDPSRIFFIREKSNALTFSDDRIAEAIRKTGARVVIFDPLSSYIGKDVSLNAANEVRAQFNPLIEVAKETGCAIIVVAHMNKAPGTKAIYRTNGSIDVVGAARSALLIARTDRDRPDERIMAVQKSNLAPTGSAILFSVGEKITWLEEVERTADEVLGSGAAIGRPDTRLEEAKTFIQAMLADGPLPAVECDKRLQDAGIRRTTSKKAKKQMGVLSERKDDIWFWRLPDESTRSQEVVGIGEEVALD